MTRVLFAFLLLLPFAAAGQAQRQAVPLTPEEREFVLAEMRDFLVMVEQVTGAVARGDFAAVAAAARPHGTSGDKGRMPPAIAQKLPPPFRVMARGTHDQIDVLAADASRRDARHTLEQTSRLLATCNACHAAFQFPR